MSKISTYNPEQEVLSLIPQYANWVSKGKDKHHFTCKVSQTNSLKLSNMVAEAWKSHVKGNSKDGKKKKTQKKYVCFENRVEKNFQR